MQHPAGVVLSVTAATYMLSMHGHVVGRSVCVGTHTACLEVASVACLKLTACETPCPAVR